MKHVRLLTLASVITAMALAATSEPPAKKEPAPAPAPKQPERKEPVNTRCPVQDEPVDANVTFEYQGKLIAFCCEACREEFRADPSRFATKVRK